MGKKTTTTSVHWYVSVQLLFINLVQLVNVFYSSQNKKEWSVSMTYLLEVEARFQYFAKKRKLFFGIRSPPFFSGVRVTRSLVLCVCFVDLCFSFRSLCYLFFFDFSLRILINPLISSNFTIFPVNLKICHDKGYSSPETPHKKYNKLLHIV